MKRMVTVLLAALVVSSTVPALAQPSKEEKDQCLLASKHCLNEADTIQKRIRRIQGEIKKGKKVYSAEELKKLQEKLEEATAILNNLEENRR